MIFVIYTILLQFKILCVFNKNFRKIKNKIKIRKADMKRE